MKNFLKHAEHASMKDDKFVGMCGKHPSVRAVMFVGTCKTHSVKKD
jgi:hypothetical protein